MRRLNRAIAIVTILFWPGYFLGAHAQSQVKESRGYSGMQSASNAVEFGNADVVTCSPAPCVMPPEWPSTSLFTADAPIAANPQNPQQLLLGSVDQDCPQNPGLGFYMSSDGGSSWQRQCMPTFLYRGKKYDPSGHPMVGYDSRGAAYEAGYYSIHDDFSSASFVAFQKSSDGGKTWIGPAPALGQANGLPAGPRMAVDANAASRYVNTVYISAVLIGPPVDSSMSQVLVSHSNDGGTTWTQVPVTPIQHYPAEDGYANLTVGKDGTVYVAWMYCDTSPYFCQDNKGHILFSKSTDGGNTWSNPKLIVTVNLNALPNTNVGLIDAPIIAVDNSNGSHSGNIYIAMYSWTGTQLRVGVVRSTDGGNTWSKPVPVAPLSETHDQFFPWLSVSPTGLVGVSWMDRRNDPANVDYQAFAAISHDGGQSFGSNVQLTTGFSDPNRGGEGGEWIGDYTGNTWAGSNNFVAAWMDNSNSQYMVDVVGGIRLK